MRTARCPVLTVRYPEHEFVLPDALELAFGFRPQGLPPGLLSPLEWAIAGKVRDVLSSDLMDLKASVERVVA